MSLSGVVIPSGFFTHEARTGVTSHISFSRVSSGLSTTWSLIPITFKSLPQVTRRLVRELRLSWRALLFHVVKWGSLRRFKLSVPCSLSWNQLRF